MGFLRQEDWNGLPFPSPQHLPKPGTETASPALAGGFFTTFGALLLVEHICENLFWALNSVPLVDMSILMAVPCCFDYYSLQYYLQSECVIPLVTYVNTMVLYYSLTDNITLISKRLKTFSLRSETR